MSFNSFLPGGNFKVEEEIKYADILRRGTTDELWITYENSNVQFN